MHLLTQAKNNVSTLELKRHLGVSYPTAWLVKHKLMEVMRLREDSRQLTGRVEIDDDAYLGGERSGGKTGRGSENKVPFIAAVQTTEDGQPVLVCFAQAPFTKEAVEEFAAKSLVRPLTVVSDGLWCFTAAESAGVHERIVTGGGKASVKSAAVPRRQYRAEQLEDRNDGHLPRRQVRQVRASLPRRGAVPALRSEIDPAAAGACRRDHRASKQELHS